MNTEKYYSITELEAMGQVIPGEAPLVDRRVQLGRANVFYPCVVIEVAGKGQISIGDENIFFPMAFIVAAQGGIILIGSNNQLGEGGVYIKANVPGAEITIGNNGRYLQGAQILGRKTQLGNGTQVIGQITVQNTNLTGGGNHTEPNPDERGAVLKGMGTARDINLQKGDVVNGWGDFSQSLIERQIAYHPVKKA